MRGWWGVAGVIAVAACGEGESLCDRAFDLVGECPEAVATDTGASSEDLLAQCEDDLAACNDDDQAILDDFYACVTDAEIADFCAIGTGELFTLAACYGPVTSGLSDSCAESAFFSVSGTF